MRELSCDEHAILGLLVPVAFLDMTMYLNALFLVAVREGIGFWVFIDEHELGLHLAGVTRSVAEQTVSFRDPQFMEVIYLNMWLSWQDEGYQDRRSRF